MDHCLIFFATTFLALLLLNAFLVDSAMFDVQVRHPSPAQKHQLGKWRQSIRHVAFAGRPKGTMLSKHQLKMAAAATAVKGAAAMGKVGKSAKDNQNNGESTEIEDLDIVYDPYFYRIWLNPQGTIKLGIPRK
jgi:hypothetical protein